MFALFSVQYLQKIGTIRLSLENVTLDNVTHIKRLVSSYFLYIKNRLSNGPEIYFSEQGLDFSAVVIAVTFRGQAANHGELY